jgi:NADP-dependent 3-hydroxy acid dehydrogenase YdfG
MTMRLDGKVAVVTGGGSGVGAAIARRFAEAGAQVAIVGRHEAPLKQVCEATKADKPIYPVAADVADREDVGRLVEQIDARFGRIDILVNNAGVNIAARRLEELAPEDWDSLMDVNATGAFNMIHAALPQMRARGEGLIISISSLAGVRPSALAGAAYSASKHALAALTKVVGLEEERNGVRATLISPGDINTPLLDKRPIRASEEQRAKILQPDDVAAAALFVATLPPHVSVPELLIKPVGHAFA